MKRIALLLIAILIGTTGVVAETFVACVGVGHYADSRVRELTKTEADAKAMAEFFRLGTENVITLTGRYATRRRIIDSLVSQFGRARRGDKIIFYFSGHGYAGGFCPHDITSVADGLSYSDVFEIMSRSEATDKIIFADACNSGAIRSQSANTVTSPTPGNTMLFLSSRGNEYSIESPFMANGYFTTHLLRGMRGAADTDGDRTITASELFRYVSDNVARQTKGKQHPVMWGNFPDNLSIVSYQ